MKATYIEHKDTHSFSKTLLAYLDNDPALLPFAGNRPDMEGFAKQLTAKTGKTDGEVLVQSLKRQYGQLLSHQTAVEANVESLTHAITFPVTTGPQLNIFTGPLYFIFKSVSTGRLPR